MICQLGSFQANIGNYGRQAVCQISYHGKLVGVEEVMNAFPCMLLILLLLAVVMSCKAYKDCIALLGIALLGRDAAASSTSIGHPTISIEALSYSFVLLLIQMPPETLDIDRALKGLSEVLISILHSWDQSTDRAEATEYHVVQQCIPTVHQ